MEWQNLKDAPYDGTVVIILTADFGAVEAYWDAESPDFYSEHKGEVPLKMGAWKHTNWYLYGSCERDGSFIKDRRLFCGETPKAWIPKPKVIESEDIW